MNNILQPGENTTLSLPKGTVVITHDIFSPIDTSLTAFLLTSGNKVQGDSGIVFFNQPHGLGGVVTYHPPVDKQGIRRHQIDFDLAKMPKDIVKIAVTLTEEGGYQFGQIKNLKAVVEIGNETFEIKPTHLTTEKGIIVLELYIRNAVPKLKSVWQGFIRGLAELCEYYGVEVETKAPVAVIKPEVKPIAGIVSSQSQPNKINLEKVSGKVNLSKGSKPILIEKTPEITATVSWKSGTDYDIYALVLTKDGQQIDVAMFGAKGVKPLKNFNNGTVEHMGDVGRGGSSTKIEVLKIRVNDNVLAIVPVVYSAQSNGTGSFYEYKVSMTIDNHSGTVVTIPAENANNDKTIYTCVPGLILNKHEGLIIETLEKYSKPGSENRPKLKLEPSGNVEILMDGGPRNNYK